MSSLGLNSSSVNVNQTSVIQTVSSMTINNVLIIPFKQARILVSLKDSTGRTVKSQNLLMDTADYSNWKNDDSYLISWCLTQLGLTQSS